MHPTTLVDLLAARAAHCHDVTRPAGVGMLTFDGVGDDDVPTETFLPWAAVHARAASFAAGLQATGLAASNKNAPPRFLLLFSPGIDFIVAWFGVQRAGGIPVPVFPPEGHRVMAGIARLRGVVGDCAPAAILVGDDIKDVVIAVAASDDVLAALPVFAVTDLDTGDTPVDVDIGAEDIAFLQYTSGSTGTPRGVRVTHHNLLTNLAQIRQAMRLSQESSGVIWLPPYHDMGLIGGILEPLFADFPVRLMSPLSFLAKPLRWMSAVERYGATISGGPNFAWDLCVRRFREARAAAAAAGRDGPSFDLSTWRVAFNGAEPIRGDTLARFADTFAAAGFSAGSFFPCYGMAEATLIVSGGASVTRRLARASLVPGAHVRDDVDGALVVGSGVAVDGVVIGVVDEAGVAVADHVVGELTVAGDNVSAGYFAVDGVVPLPRAKDGALKTGDLGFVDGDGVVFVTGRAKDLIIVRGRNLYPMDLEAGAEAAHPGVRRGAAVAFAVVGAFGEEVGVAVEAAVDSDHAAIAAAVRAAVAGEFGVAVAVVAVCPPQALPKTSSGKLQRSTTAAALADGTLPTLLVARDEQVRRVDDDVVLYPELAARFARLDRRHTRYRYDEDKDIRWAAIDDDGRYAGPVLFRAHRLDDRQLAQQPEAFDLVQWCIAVCACDTFVCLEEAVLRFSQHERARLGPTRSLEILEEEEEKHVHTFRRLADALRARHPEHAAAVDEQRRISQRFYDKTALWNLGDHPDDARHHYITWLITLFFEEYTIWFHDLLAAEPDGVIQPTWIDAHRCHAQEETQHVVTDAAYLACLQATEEERFAWSKEVFDDLLKNFTNMLVPWQGAFLRARPDLAATLQSSFIATDGDEPLLFSLLRHERFALTVAAAPWLAHALERPRTASSSSSTSSSSMSPQVTALSSWIAAWGARATPGFDPARSFADNGCDSVQLVGLAGDLETHTGRRLPPTVAYDHPTVAALAAHVAGVVDAALVVPTPTRPGPLPLSWRQQRLVALDDAGRARGAPLLDHITVCWQLDPAHTATSTAALVERVERALRAMALRHETLRLRLDDDGHAFAPDGIDACPLRATSIDDDLDDRVAALAAEQDATAFDLTRELPWRAHLVVAPGRAVLVFTVHHIATDGWSMATLWRELSTALLSSSSSSSLPLPSLPEQFADVAARERHDVEGPGRATLDWWRARLGDHPRFTQPLPADVDAWEGGSVVRVVDAATVDRLHEAARRRGVTLYVLLLTHFVRCQQAAADNVDSADDLLINTHLFNRHTPVERALVGYFVNLLTLRPGPRAAGFDAALKAVRIAWLEALDHAISIDALVADLRPDGFARRVMPAKVAFNMLAPVAPMARGLVSRADLEPPPSFLFFDQMLVAGLQPGGTLRLCLWHNRVAVDDDAAAGFVDGFIAGLSEIR